MTFEFDEYDRHRGGLVYLFIRQLLYPLAIFISFILFIDWVDQFSFFYKVIYVIVSIFLLYCLMKLVKFLCMHIFKKHHSLMVGERIELRQGDQVIGTAPINMVSGLITASQKYWLLIQLEDGSRFPEINPIKRPGHGLHFIESIAQEIHRHVKFTSIVERNDKTDEIKKYTDFKKLNERGLQGDVKIWLKESSSLNSTD